MDGFVLRLYKMLFPAFLAYFFHFLPLTSALKELSPPLIDYTNPIQANIAINASDFTASSLPSSFLLSKRDDDTFENVS